MGGEKSIISIQIFDWYFILSTEKGRKAKLTSSEFEFRMLSQKKYYSVFAFYPAC